MEKKFIKKFFITGIIILFIGASVFPVASSAQKENKNIPTETPKPQAFPILSQACRFNITFFGNVTRNHPMVMGNLIIFQRAVSTDSSSGSVGELTIINWMGNEYHWVLPDYVIFRGWIITDFNTNLQPAQETYQGYMSGWAIFLMIAW